MGIIERYEYMEEFTWICNLIFEMIKMVIVDLIFKKIPTQWHNIKSLAWYDIVFNIKDYKLTLTLSTYVKKRKIFLYLIDNII